MKKAEKQVDHELEFIKNNYVKKTVVINGKEYIFLIRKYSL